MAHAELPFPLCPAGRTLETIYSRATNPDLIPTEPPHESLGSDTEVEDRFRFQLGKLHEALGIEPEPETDREKILDELQWRSRALGITPEPVEMAPETVATEALHLTARLRADCPIVDECTTLDGPREICISRVAFMVEDDIARIPREYRR